MTPNYSRLPMQTREQYVRSLATMTPESAMGFINQFSSFTDTVKCIAADAKEVCISTINTTSETAQTTLRIVETAVTAISNQLDKENLSFNERLEVMDKLCELSRLAASVHESHAKHIWASIKEYVPVAIAGICAAVSIGIEFAGILGGQDNQDNDDQEHVA